MRLRCCAVGWCGLVAAVALAGCSTVPRENDRVQPRLDGATRVLSNPNSSQAEIEQARRTYRSAVKQALRAEGARVTIRYRQADFPNLDAHDIKDVVALSRDAGSDSPLVRRGVGLPVVLEVGSGQPNAPDRGQRVPATLTISGGEGMVLQNSLTTETVAFGEVRRPLAMNLRAVIDRTQAMGPRALDGFLQSLFPDRLGSSGRLVFLQPYDPGKIPVVLVHGLFSTPRMWAPVIARMWEDPDIRDNVQFWFFHYPTGQPIPYSALRLREELDRAVGRLTPAPRPMVLIGHSMGGILSRAMVSSMDPELVSEGAARLPSDHIVRRALTLSPRRDVSRVVFIATPHRGSAIANAFFGGLGMSVLRMPIRLAGDLENLTLPGLRDTRGRLPTSIHGLSPGSRFLTALANTSPSVPSHSIIGIRGARDLATSSDGIVDYASAHVADAASEVTVRSGHGAHVHPDAIAEVVRILESEISLPTGSTLSTGGTGMSGR